jgi:hypothetical protein
MYGRKVMDIGLGLNGEETTLIREVIGMLRCTEATLHLLPTQIEQSGLRHRKAGR